MKAVSLYFPWAGLIARGHIGYVFRDWKEDYRGQVLIHERPLPDTRVGRVLAIAELTGRREAREVYESLTGTEREFFIEARCPLFAYRLADVHPLLKPVAAPEGKGLWTPAAAIQHAVFMQLPQQSPVLKD